MIFAHETMFTEEEKKFLENYVDSIINGCKEETQNCNHCKFNQNASKYLDVEDYCILNKKKICMISVDKDCPLEELEDNNL